MNYKKIIASLAILAFCFLSFSFANTVKAADPVITTLTVTQAPSNTDGTVDDALQTQPIVNVKDETSANMPGVTVTAVLVDGTGSIVAGNTAVTDANGDATFSGLKYNKSGETFTIKFTAGAIETAKSANITALTNGETTNFLIAGIDDPVVAGTTITSFTVTARDQYNNIAEDYIGTIEFSSSDISATLPADYTFVVGDNGVATFSNGVVLTKAGDQTVIATDTSDATITGAQTGITVTHDVATKYVIINPTDGTVDNPITVTVQLQDQYDNIVTTGADKDKGVTLVTDGSATGAGLVTISNGVGTLNISNTLPETVNLSLTDSQGTGFNVSSTQDVVFAHGVATKVVFTQEPSTPTVAGVSFTNQPIVNILDQYNNLVSSDNTSSVVIKAFTTSDCLTAASPDLTGTLNVQAINGVSTFSGISYTKTSPGNLYVQASLGALTPACSGALTITPASAISLLVDSISNPLTAGVASDVKVTAIDEFGNVDTNYVGTVGFASSDTKITTTLPSPYTFVAGDNGVKTFVGGVKLTTSGNQTVSASDGLISGAQTGIVVNNAGGSKYVIINPTDGTVDNPITVTVQLQDQYDNIVTTGADKDKGVTLVTNSSAGTGMFLVTISNGIGTKNITNQKAETVGLSLFDGGATGFDVSSTQDVIFAHGVATKVVFTQEPSTPTVAGIPFADQPIVAIQDQYDNVITSDNTSNIVIKAYNNPACSIAANPDLHGTLNVQAINGVSTFSGISYTKTSLGNLYVKASVGGFSVCSGVLTITPATASRLTVDSVTNPIVAGIPSNVQVTAFDAFDNIDTNYAGTIHFTSSDVKTTTVLPADYTFVAGDNGVKTFTNGVVLTTAGTQSVGAHDTVITSIKGIQTGIVVNNTSGSKYVIINPTDGTVDNPITVTVQLQDQYDNIVTTGADKDKGVTLVTDGSATGAGLVTISNGVGTLNISNTLPETVNLSLTDSQGTGFNVSSIQDVIFVEGVATELYFSVQPSNKAYTYVNFGIQPTVVLRDQFGNVRSDVNPVTLLVDTVDNTCLNAAANADFIGTKTQPAGTSFVGLKYNKIDTDGIWLCATSGALKGVSNKISVYTSSAPSSSGGSTSYSTAPTTTIPQGEVLGISIEKKDDFGALPQPAKPIAEMNEAEKNEYKMQLQQFLIQLLTQLLTLLKK